MCKGQETCELQSDAEAVERVERAPLKPAYMYVFSKKHIHGMTRGAKCMRMVYLTLVSSCVQTSIGRRVEDDKCGHRGGASSIVGCVIVGVQVCE